MSSQWSPRRKSPCLKKISSESLLRKSPRNKNPQKRKNCLSIRKKMTLESISKMLSMLHPWPNWNSPTKASLGRSTKITLQKWRWCPNLSPKKSQVTPTRSKSRTKAICPFTMKTRNQKTQGSDLIKPAQPLSHS